jgi:hypothetical protein
VKSTYNLFVAGFRGAADTPDDGLPAILENYLSSPSERRWWPA